MEAEQLYPDAGDEAINEEVKEQVGDGKQLGDICACEV